MSSALIAQMVKEIQDHEDAEFVRIMQHGTEEEQETAVEAAADRALDAMRAAP